MKKWKKAIILMSAIFIVLVCMASKEANLKYVFAGMIYGASEDNSNIIFSKESGFYDEEFELYIYAPTDEIYYTLDGTDPDINSFKYKQGIHISDASEKPNVYSNRKDVTTRLSEKADELYSDILEEPIYKIPESNIDKCNIIKVAYYDKEGNRSNIEERVYFVDFENKEGYENIKIISITTSPENLFDYENGIYVTGEYFDAYCEEGIPERRLNQWEKWDANYHQRGDEWERECRIYIFDENRTKVLAQNAGLRIQGGTSRSFLPKSLNIYARKEYGKNELEYDFWGTGYTPKRITLTSGGQDYYTKIKDRLVSELAENCNVATMHYVPCALFLNGEYWGFYYLTEKYDENFIEYYYNLEEENIDENLIIIKNSKVEVGDIEDIELYDRMVSFISEYDMSIEENYQEACSLIDIDSFIDYYAIESYIARCGDWPKSNYAVWRSRNVSDKPYEDGKWRWMLFDVNSTSMMSYWPEFDYIEENRKDSPVFDSLCENKEFREKFSNRIIELSNTSFDKEIVNQKITEYVQLMEEPMEKHFQRFFGTSNDLFYAGCEDIRLFFNERKPYIKEIIDYHFK